MELHNLQTAEGSRKGRKRIGRGNGSGHGTTSGRGTKGQKSRSGGKIRRGFEGGQMPLYRRIPKRGFNNLSRKTYSVVNLEELEKRFDSGVVISPEEMIKSKLIRKLNDGIKVLGDGELTKAIHVKAHKFSQSAVEKIKAAGGTIEELK